MIFIPGGWFPDPFPPPYKKRVTKFNLAVSLRPCPFFVCLSSCFVLSIIKAPSSPKKMHAKIVRAFSWVLYWFAIQLYTENARQNLAGVSCAREGRGFVIHKPENARKKIAGISYAREGRKGGVLIKKEWHRGRARCLSRVLGAGTNVERTPFPASPVHLRESAVSNTDAGAPVHLPRISLGRGASRPFICFGTSGRHPRTALSSSRRVTAKTQPRSRGGSQHA